MDIKQLQIGDWVSINDNDLRVNGNCKVEYVEKSDEEYGVVVSDRQLVFFNDCVEPIPITAEILEKNGYAIVNSQRYELGEYESEYYVNVNHKKHIAHINGHKNNANLYDCIYVHELQHALRLCGLNELADSLKV